MITFINFNIKLTKKYTTFYHYHCSIVVFSVGFDLMKIEQKRKNRELITFMIIVVLIHIF